MYLTQPRFRAGQFFLNTIGISQNRVGTQPVILEGAYARLENGSKRLFLEDRRRMCVVLHAFGAAGAQAEPRHFDASRRTLAGLRIGEFGRRPLQAVRDELNRANAERAAEAVIQRQTALPTRFPASRYLTAPAASGLDDPPIRLPRGSPPAMTDSGLMRPYGNNGAVPPIPAHQDDWTRPVEP